jgi:ABC-type phosphate transport system permease subunit
LLKKTLIIVTLSSIIAIPISIITGFFVVEYLTRKLSLLLSNMIEIMAAVPSVIFGIIGIALLGAGIPSAVLVLSIMITPIILSRVIAVINTVSVEIKNNAVSLGIKKFYVTLLIFKNIIPEIKKAVMWGIARAMGETMALIMLLGASTEAKDNTLSTIIGIK